MYGVDVRVGCVAIIRKDVKPPSLGLHFDDYHVVKYWHGVNMTGKLFGMPYVTWHVPQYMVRRAKRIAEKYNKKINRT